MTSRFYCQQTEAAQIVQSTGEGVKAFLCTHFAAPSNTEGVSNMRLWISTHKFWHRIAAV